MITDYKGVVKLVGDICSICIQFTKAYLVFVTNGNEYNAQCGGDKKVMTNTFKTMFKRYKDGKGNESEKMLTESVLTALSATYSIKELPQVFLDLLNDFLPPPGEGES